ncbi:hypothetical protein CLU79DRAFT_753109 [Phycomyces nitens]|nr:hypothetical protein CLU79DRAFT_753109 [Phycomyces nitens]
MGIQHITETISSESQSPKDDVREANISLMHYILVSPIAALYIVGRALLDVLRLGVYWILWLCEQSVPHIDDWLFKTVTESIPLAISRLEEWWDVNGSVLLRNSAEYINTTALPAIVAGIERGFGWLYSIGMTIYGLWNMCDMYIAANMDDWKRMLVKLWEPLEMLLLRASRILVLVYTGCYYGAISLWQDIRWASSVIPYVVSYIGSSWIATKITKTIQSGTVWVYGHVWPVLAKLGKQAILPVLDIAGILAVRGVEWIESIVESRGFRNRLLHFRQTMFSNVVWAVLDGLELVKDINIWVGYLITTMVVPTVILLVQHLLPRLSKAHHRLQYMAIGVLQNHLYPLWVQMYPYVQQPLMDVWHKIGTLVMPLKWIVLLNWSGRVIAVFQELFERARPGMAFLLDRIRSWGADMCGWLESQAPLLAKAMEQIWGLVKEWDWAGLQSDFLAVYWVMYNAVSVQSDLLFGSLERALGTWALEQSTNPKDKLAGGPSE